MEPACFVRVSRAERAPKRDWLGAREANLLDEGTARRREDCRAGEGGERSARWCEDVLLVVEGYCAAACCLLDVRASRDASRDAMQRQT